MLRLLAATMLALLAGCATVPAKPTFSPRQVAVLQENGFKPVGENYELGLSDRVLFEVDKSDLLPPVAATLDRVTHALTATGIHGATVEGYTDSTGTAAYNQGLSERRANAVKAQLVASGMAAAEVVAIGRGQADPIADNATEEGRAQNRRVVIMVSPANAIPIRD